ncbi:MAG: histone deacetylase family protein [Candidatus Thorarchaeota archaeon]|jgi:acetoin utilization protein AcuC
MSPSLPKCNVGFTWSPDLETFDYGSKHPIRVGRFQMIRDFLQESRFLEYPNVKTITPEPISTALLGRIHSQEYLEKVQRISETGQGEIDVDTPGFKGIYENARITSGATVTGVQAILDNQVNHFFSPTGGFHHARFEAGGGFCIFNDVAASVYHLKDLGYNRILIADFDVHHGNGTQTYFYDDPGVMQISFHEDPEWMYPHDGFVEDIGKGVGKGYNINMPFPMDSGDAVYRYAFDAIVPPLLNYFQPEFILFLPGFDTHYEDPLTHMNLTLEMIRYVAENIHAGAHRWAEGRLGIISGGGYNRAVFQHGAGAVMSVLSGHDYRTPPQNAPFEDDEAIWKEVKENTRKVQDLVFPALGI